MTYSRVGGQVKTLTFCQGSHYLAVASDNGSVQLLAVEANKPPKSPKVQPFQSRYQNLQLHGLVGFWLWIWCFQVIQFSLWFQVSGPAGGRLRGGPAPL